MLRTPTKTMFNRKDEIKEHFELLNKKNQQTISMLADTLDLDDINFIAQFDTAAFWILAKENIKKWNKRCTNKKEVIKTFNDIANYRLKYLQSISNLWEKYPHITRLQLLPVLLSGESWRAGANKANKEELKVLCKEEIIDKAVTYIADDEHIQRTIEEITEHFGNAIRDTETLGLLLRHNIKSQASKLRNKDDEITQLPTSHLSYKSRAKELDKQIESGWVLERHIDNLIENFNLEKAYQK